MRSAALLGLLLLSSACNDERDARDPSAFIGNGGDVSSGPPSSNSPTDGGTIVPTDSGTVVPTDAGTADMATISTTDVFDPASCAGTALTATTTAPYLALGLRATLGQAVIMERTRTCATPTSCTAWSTAQPYMLTLTTYSGGVTTHTKTFTFPTTLILWQQGTSTYKYSVRSTPDVTECPSCDSNGAVFDMGPLIPQISYPDIHLWDPTPDHPEDYQDLGFPIAPVGNLVVTDSCARFTAHTNDSSPGAGDHTQELAALYYLP